MVAVSAMSKTKEIFVQDFRAGHATYFLASRQRNNLIDLQRPEKFKKCISSTYYILNKR